MSRPTMRLFMTASRSLRTLDEVNAVLKHFESYGRLLEFSIRRDFYSRERDRFGGMTYSDKAAAMNVLKEPHHIVKITKPSPQDSEDTSINQSLEKSSKPILDDEIKIRVTVSRMDLATIIKLRMGTQLRTNATVQSRVNKCMLHGFEGFHGELTKLWDNVQDIAREEVVRRVAEDKLRNQRKGKKEEKNKTRWEVSHDESLNPILTDTWTVEKKQDTGRQTSSHDGDVITLEKINVRDIHSQTVSLEITSQLDSESEDTGTEASLNQLAAQFDPGRDETTVEKFALTEPLDEPKLKTTRTSTGYPGPLLQGKD